LQGESGCGGNPPLAVRSVASQFPPLAKQSSAGDLKLREQICAGRAATMIFQDPYALPNPYA